MQEKIFLTYTSATAIPYQGSTLGHHAVLNYIDSSGYHHTLQGTPEHKFEHNIGKMGAFLREEALSDGANNTDSPFGRLRVEPQKTDSGSALDQPRTMIAEGDDLSSQWALMRDFADEVNSTGYEYRPISQNSNSFAGGALQRAGFFGPGTASPERFDSQTVLDPVSGEPSTSSTTIAIWKAFLMSADIIHFIPRPKHGREQTDFPTIAFRFPVRPDDPPVDHVDTAPCEYVAPEAGET